MKTPNTNLTDSAVATAILSTLGANLVAAATLATGEAYSIDAFGEYHLRMARHWAFEASVNAEPEWHIRKARRAISSLAEKLRYVSTRRLVSLDYSRVCRALVRCDEGRGCGSLRRA